MRNKRHITFIAGLWFWATIWPFLSIPLHFKLVEHHVCHWQTDDEGTTLSEPHTKCPICNFQFFWRDTPREQVVLKRIEIALCIVNEHPLSLHISKSYSTLLLRGPPDLA